VDKMSWPHTNSLCWLFIIPMGSSINTFIRNYHQSTYILGLCMWGTQAFTKPKSNQDNGFLIICQLEGLFFTNFFLILIFAILFEVVATIALHYPWLLFLFLFFGVCVCVSIYIYIYIYI
jgi:hypothetical protein